MKQTNQLKNTYKGLRILITGHTGFKGSWLALWLSMLEAEIAGYSLYLPSDPCHYQACYLDNHLTNIEGDVRDENKLLDLFSQFQPDVVFHLAAQPIVMHSYQEPKKTFETNVIGTVNVLECIRKTPSVRAGVIITSDKCYENFEWHWGYRENDRLGGKDPYSASKACAEIAASAYMRSFFSETHQAQIATVRAGNVIGGGDWAADRIVPDCVRSLSQRQLPEIRNPRATRPWQHVLEPLSGYLWTGVHLLEKNIKVKNSAFNFGPSYKESFSVGDLTNQIVKEWGKEGWLPPKSVGDCKECTNLKLNSDKAHNILHWHSVMNFEETVQMTVRWYKSFYEDKHDMYKMGLSQIEEYTSLAIERGLNWSI